MIAPTAAGGRREWRLFWPMALVGAASLRLYRRPRKVRRAPPQSERDVLENGAIAQLGERFNGIEEVVGSIPSGSTIPKFIKSLSKSTSESSAGWFNMVELCVAGSREVPETVAVDHFSAVVAWVVGLSDREALIRPRPII